VTGIFYIERAGMEVQKKSKSVVKKWLEDFEDQRAISGDIIQLFYNGENGI